MTDLTILGLPPSTYVRTVRMACAVKGLRYTLQPVNFRKPEYRAHHPFGRIPVLQHGDVAIYEALAIGVYIDEAFDGPALQPTDALGRARMMQWISATNDYIYASIVACCMAERFIKPMRGLDPDEAKIAAAMPDMAEHLDIIAAGLTGPYLCGEAVTLADLFLAPVIHYLAATPEGEALLPPRPVIGAWMDLMALTPDFADINKMGP